VRAAALFAKEKRVVLEKAPDPILFGTRIAPWQLETKEPRDNSDALDFIQLRSYSSAA